MHLIRTLACAFCLVFGCTAPALAGDVVLASGAGYKKMVNALHQAYEQKTGHSLSLIFGNMGRVTMLARESGKVSFVLGDESFLNRAKLPLVQRVELGRGKLVLAFSRESGFSSVKDLDNTAAGRIALPDTHKAIYGKAAREFLTATGRLPAIKPRLVEVATIPQVFSYLNTNEVDMGFLNLTHALNVKDKIGGYVLVDETKYSPIRIIVGMLEGCPDTERAAEFLEFLSTPEAKAIASKHGL